VEWRFRGQSFFLCQFDPTHLQQINTLFLSGALSHLLSSLVRNDIAREIMHELGEVALDVTDRDIQRLL
jgi:hypothetical protein